MSQVTFSVLNSHVRLVATVSDSISIENISITTASSTGQCSSRLNFQFTGNIGDAIQIELHHEEIRFFGKDNYAGKNRRQREKRKTKYEID